MHIFTGVADSPGTTLRRAHEVYDEALAAQTARLEIPGKQPDSWGARGLRPGWQLEWPAAKASPWNNPQLDRPRRLRVALPGDRR
ncbi:hypothetical protein ACFC1B_30955, partial [Streptomyces xiamenensis]